MEALKRSIDQTLVLNRASLLNLSLVQHQLELR